MKQNKNEIINAESLNIDTTLEKLSKELKPDETLILDVGNNYFEQTDAIYDTLVMRAMMYENPSKRQKPDSCKQKTPIARGPVLLCHNAIEQSNQ